MLIRALSEDVRDLLWLALCVTLGKSFSFVPGIMGLVRIMQYRRWGAPFWGDGGPEVSPWSLCLLEARLKRRRVAPRRYLPVPTCPAPCSLRHFISRRALFRHRVGKM